MKGQHVVDSKQLRFFAELSAVQGNEALVGTKTINVEFHGTDPFLGLSVWHEEHRKTPGPAFVVLSRTASISSKEEFQSFETSQYQVNTTYDVDPLTAAGRALRRHLKEFLPDELGRGVKAGIERNAFYRYSYDDQVVEPICTAVLGMCRDARLYESLGPRDVLWAVGTWRLGKNRDEKRLDELLNLGELIQDVLVIKNEGDKRRRVQNALW